MEQSHPMSPEYVAVQKEMRKIRRLKRKHGDFTGMVMYMTGFTKEKLDALGGVYETGRPEDSERNTSWGRTQSCLHVLVLGRVCTE
jgi:L-fucose isomerase-like protein